MEEGGRKIRRKKKGYKRLEGEENGSGISKPMPTKDRRKLTPSRPLCSGVREKDQRKQPQTDQSQKTQPALATKDNSHQRGKRK